MDDRAKTESVIGMGQNMHPEGIFNDQFLYRTQISIQVIRH
jgi:hypothetical protein